MSAGARVWQRSCPSRRHSEALVVPTLLLLAVVASLSYAREKPFTGCRRATPEELAWEDAHFTHLSAVRPNALGLKRINSVRRARGDRPLTMGDSVFGSPSALTLPSQVDNSQLKYFPPIGLQNGGCCGAFAPTYYTMTHMTAMARDWDVSIGDTNRIFSTKFTFSLNNKGVDDGAHIGSVMWTALKHGCPTLSRWPYVDGEGPQERYQSWPMDPAVWEDALPYRMAEVGAVSNVHHQAGLDQVRQLLNNGYVANVAIWIFSTVVTNAKDNVSTTNDDAFVNQTVVVGLRAPGQFEDGHALTIVGYNDTVWTDVNDNGVIDADELGVFLVANSWGGTSLWTPVSYWAVKHVYDMFWDNRAYWMTAREDYNPRLIAKCTVNQLHREAVGLTVGSGETTDSAPADEQTVEYWTLQSYAGEERAYDGEFQPATPQDFTYVLDCTDVAPSGNEKKRFFIEVTDEEDYHFTTIKDCRLVDLTAGEREVAHSSLPVVCDRDSGPRLFGINYGINTTRPIVQIPESMDELYCGETGNLRWLPTGVGLVDIVLCRDNRPYMTLLHRTPDDGEATWQVPEFLPGDDNYSVRVQAAGAPSVSDMSDAFRINAGVHRFEWSAVTSPQTWATPFPATITARTPSGTTAAGFNGTARLRGERPVVRIGDGTLEQDYPFFSHGSAAHITCIIPADQLPEVPTRLHNLSLDFSELSSTWFDTCIRIQHTELARFESGATFKTNGWTTCCQEQVTFWNEGWHRFDLTTPFDYDGTRNLLLYITAAPTELYGQNPMLGAHDSVGEIRALCRVFFPDSNPTSGRVFPTVRIPNMRFNDHHPQDLVIAPSNTGSFVNGVWSGSVAVQDGCPAVRLVAECQGAAGRTAPIAVTGQTTLELDVSLSRDRISEGGSPQAFDVVVSRNSTVGATAVTLTSSRLDLIDLSEAVTIADGQRSTPHGFNGIIGNAVEEGDQTVTITATATGHLGGRAEILVWAADLPWYVLKVYGAHGVLRDSQTLREGETCRFEAYQAEAGKMFDKWTGVSTQYLADVEAARVTMPMPAANLTLYATYEDVPAGTYTLTVETDLGFGRSSYARMGPHYSPGAEVPIMAEVPTGRVFYVWGGGGGGVQDPNSQKTTVIMPSRNVSVIGNTRPAPDESYTLTVFNGTGGGDHAAGAAVTVRTKDPPAQFDHWVGDTMYLPSTTGTTVTFSMPATDMMLMAQPTDGSWIPSDWLAGYGWHTDLDQVVMWDTDGDGHSTWQEFVAGSDPTRRDSVFALQGVAGVFGGSPATVLSWQGLRGRLYSVRRTTDLGLPMVDLPDFTRRPGRDGVMSYTNRDAFPRQYFELEVRLHD